MSVAADPVPVNQRRRIAVLRGLGLFLLAPVLLAAPRWGFEGAGHEALEVLGLALLLVGVGGRVWSILYVGARKNRRLVTEGPYSLTRNPLYLFSTIAATGIGLMIGAVAYGILVGGTVGLVLWMTARMERDFLRASFDDYDAYAAEVPFFLPRPTGYRTGREVTFDAAVLTRNLRDALVFLAFIPLVEVLDLAHASGWLPQLIQLP